VVRGIPESDSEQNPQNETRTFDGPALAAPGTPPREDLTSGELLANRYLVEGELGRGGGGIVYRAFDQGAQLWVAIKLLNPEKWSGAQSSEQLYRELRFGRSIQHPNVCRIYDVFEAQGRCLLVMEYAGAGTLRATLRDKGANRPLDDRVADARGVIAGLAAIHRAGLVHRDFKPENILRMIEGRLVVSDFGLTREIGQTTTTTGLAGTPGYLAPESLTGLKAGQVSDVWTLGVVLHEILEGNRPDVGEGRGGGTRRSRRKLDSREARLLALARLCLEPDPRRRPASAIEVEAQLEGRRLGGGRAARWLRLGLGALVLLGATGGIAVGWRRLRAPAPPAAERAPVDRAGDWSRSRLVLALAGSYCLQGPGPGGRTAHAVSRVPPGVVEIDVETGAWTHKAEGAELGCLARSPDGSAVLFTRAGSGPGQVMLARGPDGQGAAPLFAGSSPRWLPSGREIAFVTPEQRLAIGDRQGRFRPLPTSGPAPVRIRAIAIDDRGDRAAAVAEYRQPPGTRIDLYDLRSGRQLPTWKPASPGTQTVEFDPARRTFQFAEERGPETVWSEWTGEGEVRVLGRLPGRGIESAVRVPGGFLFTAPIKSAMGNLYRVAPDGSEQYISARARQFRVSARGDLVYVHLDRTERAIVIIKRPDTPVTDLSEPDMFGDPDISADGREVVFDHLLTGEVFRCDLSSGDHRSRCQIVWVDRRLLPGPGLALAPAGGEVAYLAQDPGGADVDAAPGGLRLRLLSLRTRQVRDLAPLAGCGPGCDVVWAAPGTIRICGAPGAPVTEIDVASGRKAERPPSGPADDGCNPQRGSHRYELRLRQAVEFRFVPDLPGQGP
jgi:hypothetical protein